MQVKPFVGPQAFGESDSSFFYGRDREVQEIIALILSSSISLVYAKSGIGKSSIFNAKVIPDLKRKKYNFQVLQMPRFSTMSVPDSQTENKKNISNVYVLNIIQEIIAKSGSKEKLKNDKSLSKEKLQSMTLSDFLENYNRVTQHERVIDKYYHELKILLFDQFEEFFNIYVNNSFEQQEHFFYQIRDAVRNDPNLRIVFVMREEFIANLDTFSQIFPDGFRRKFRLEPLRKEQAIQAVERPLLQAMLLEPRLKDILNEQDINKIANRVVENLLRIHVQRYDGAITKDKERSRFDARIFKVFGLGHSKLESDDDWSEIIRGEFVEPVQLQVVCLKLWENKILTGRIQSEIDSISFGDVDNALTDFYDDAVKAAKAGTRSKEHAIRRWCEEKLITSAGTRNIVYQDAYFTAGMSNKVVNILQSKYLVHAEERARGKWFELTHDRLIKPIIDSNNKWRYESNKKKKAILLKVGMPSSILSVILVSYLVIIPLLFPPAVDPNAELIGPNPSRLTVNSDTNKIFVTSAGDNTVSIIDRKDNNSIYKIQMDQTVGLISADNDTIYALGSNISDINNYFISMIDGTENRIIGHIPILIESIPYSMVVDPIRNKIYVGYSNNTDFGISVIDPNTNNTYNIAINREPIDMDINLKSNTIYVTGYAYNSDNYTPTAINIENETNKIPYNNSEIYDYGISFIDGNNPSNVTEVPLKGHVRNDTMAVDQNTNMIYVTNFIDKSISVINGITGEISDIEIDSSLYNIAVDGDKVYALTSDSVLVVDAEEEKVLVEIRVDPDARKGSLIDLSIDRKEKIVYVSDFGSNKIYPIKENGYELEEPILGPEPKGIKLDEEAYGIGVNEETNMIYLVSDSFVRAVNGTTDKVVIDKIKVDEDSRLIAVDGGTNQIIPGDKHWNDDTNTIFVINGTTGTVTDDDISISSFPVSMAVNNETNIVYIAGANHSSGHTIAELHVINGGVNGTSYNTENYILNGTVPSSMAVDPERNLIYALESGKLSVIDGKTYNQTDVIELKGVKSTDETLFDRNRNIIYTTNSENNSISVIDGKSRNVINDIHLTEIVPSDMAFDPVGNELYVSGQVNYSPFRLVDSVLRLDPTNESRGKPILLGGISGDIAVNTFTNKIYALNEDPAGVTIIDTK